jgi:hypothetical protein
VPAAPSGQSIVAVQVTAYPLSPSLTGVNATTVGAGFSSYRDGTVEFSPLVEQGFVSLPPGTNSASLWNYSPSPIHFYVMFGTR